MLTLYLTSSQEGSGKTTLAAGLGKQWQKGGKKVGYLKIPDGKTDGDAAFMKKILGLPEPAEKLSIAADTLEKVKRAYTEVASGKDVVIIEGLPLEASSGVVEALGAKVIAVEGYGFNPVTANYKKLGGSLLGIVFNKVPKKKLAAVQSQMSTELSKSGINLLGVLPEDRLLIAPTIGELAETVQGKLISGAERSAELVESFMLGAMTIDPGPLYYGRKSNKAVLVRSDRPDMQMAALETPTRCLVLTGNTAPIPAVLGIAASKKVAIIQASKDIKTLATDIENAFAAAKFNQEKKLARLGEILGQGFNFKAITV